MRAQHLRLLAFAQVAVCLFLFALIGGLAPAAAADPIGDCTATVGTIVAVDFAHWGGPIVRGCGVNQSSGYTLLLAAGFTTVGTQQEGPAFICRLGNQAFNNGTQYPTASEDPCQDTPPASAYWSYWLAPAGQNTWSYSREGAMDDVPKPGEVEAWTFGATNAAGTSGAPDFTPASVRATNTAPIPVTTSAVATTPAPATSTTHATITTSPPSPAAQRTQSGHAQTTQPTTSVSSTSAHPTPTSSRASPTSSSPSQITSSVSSSPSGSGTPTIVNAEPAAVAHTSTGSFTPLVIAGFVILGLGGGAFWTIRRRRVTDE